MLNLKLILKNDKEKLVHLLKTRGFDVLFLLEKAEKLIKKIGILNDDLQPIQEERNLISKEIGILKRDNKNVDEILKKAENISSKQAVLNEEMHKLQGDLINIQMQIPNVPMDEIKIGEDESENTILSLHGEITQKNSKHHEDIANELGLIDTERAVKISGARFTMYKGEGAKLVKALERLMIDTHEINGFEEIIPPILVKRSAMTGTGQLPKFGDDAYHDAESDLWLVPTSEVCLTNIHSNEIIDEELLPIKYTAFTPCFRKEAGSSGKDTKGLIRLHQFNKVELVKFVKPENNEKEFQELVNNATKILDLLELPYRVVELCTGDIGFSSAKTHDIEVWMPSQGCYREISSASTFEDYQARRTMIRYKGSEMNKPKLVYTQNASGLAIDRTVAALLENHIQDDGSIYIPKPLQKYMSNKTRIIKK